MQEHDARFSLTLNDLSMDLIDMSIALYAVSYQITSIFNQAPLTTVQFPSTITRNLQIEQRYLAIGI